MNRYDETDQDAGALPPGANDRRQGSRNIDLIMRIPVSVQVVLGSTTMTVANLMKLSRGSVVKLDRNVGEPVDVLVNGHIVARGEVVVIEEDNSRLGVSLTEVITPASTATGS
ncbi:hypothetical protein BH10PSE7_BH10PSE7_30710 [soil metagenome]